MTVKKPKKTDKRGGQRHRSGRKPVEDKRLHVNIYVEESKIIKLGGNPAVQELCYKHINDTIAALPEEK